MDSIQIPITLTPADWAAYRAAYQLRWRGWATRRERILSLLVSMIITAGSVLALRFMAVEFSISSFVLGAVAIAIIVYFVQRRVGHVAASDFGNPRLAVSTMTFDASGILVEKASSTTRLAWAAVQGSTVTAEHVVLWLSRLQGMVVPLRGLPADISPSQFITSLREFAPAVFANDAGAVAVGEQDLANPLPLRTAIARLFTLRRVTGTALQASDRQIFWLGFIGIVLALGIDRWLAGTDATFSTYGLLLWAWYALAGLTAAWLISRTARPRVEFQRALLLLVAFFPMAMLLYGAASLWVPEAQQYIAFLAVLGYGVLFLERGLRSITSRLQLRAIALVLVLVGILTMFGSAEYWNAQLWYSDDDETAEDAGDGGARQQQIEGVLFDQASRIDAAVAKLQRPAQRPAAAFFIGFAGYGEQEVFATEIALAERVISAKFDANGRALELVNDRHDLQTYPLASPTGLRYALKAVARHMNLDQDVLFLSLSSHGSKEGTVSVSNPGFPLNDLSASELARQLRESGIQWKVVMVSACYSGTFIAPLRDDHTIIITAAAADRTSFGCADDRDLTYFGEAFYRDALPKAATLRAAFEQTRVSIAAREKREGEIPSNPQAFFGHALEAHLAALRVGQ